METLTLLLTCDQDVIESIQDLAPVAIDSLVCMLPPSADQPLSIRMVEIGEIWALAGTPTTEPVFVERNGLARRSRSALQRPYGSGLELFARVGAEASAGVLG